jgi:hypothetical protein
MITIDLALPELVNGRVWLYELSKSTAKQSSYLPEQAT